MDDEPIFAGKDTSLKEYLINDKTRANYNQMYSILQDGLSRLEREYATTTNKDEVEELEALVNSFKNGLYLLEKGAIFIASQKN